MANYWCNVIQCRMGLGCKNTLIKDANTILKLYLYFFAVNTASNVKKKYIQLKAGKKYLEIERASY